MPVRGMILDLDGCIYRGKKPIEGAPEAVSEMSRRGVRLLFFTNNATKTPEEYAQTLRDMGVDTSREGVLTSSMVAASHLKRTYGNLRVYVVGSEALIKVLEAHGHKIVESNSDAVVTGLDFEFNYRKLWNASREIRRGAFFIATNADATVPIEGDLMPGAGSIVKAIEVASGAKPLVVGKPSRIAIKEAISRLRLKPEEVLVVGDRPETDVKMGKRLKCKTALVLTGVTKVEDLPRLPEKLRPDFIVESLKDLLRILDEAY